jgi:predicted amidohydrolase YtcJ
VLSLAAHGNGPRKIVLHDHEPLDYDVLLSGVRDAHDAGRGVALHAVTAAALAMAVAALTEAGSHPGDRVEHAAVCDDVMATRLAELGVVVVTQPTIYARRHEQFRAESEDHERGLLWRYGGLLRAGVRVAVSSDAPYGDPDPAATIRAATTREASECVSPETVLAALLTPLEDPAGAPRTVGVGAPADLCVLQQPLDIALAGAMAGVGLPVRATFVAGRLSYAAS